MGMLAVYQEIKKKDLEKLLESEDLIEDIEDFIGFTFPNRVIEISKKINEINFQDYLKSFNMDKFKENKIYPNIWDYTDEKEEIMKELSDSFASLKKFYNEVAKNKNAILISIY